MTDDEDELSEINVTPFIDVMLVLLIVFMVAAPLSTVDVQVNLPASSALPAERPAEPVWLTVRADRVLHLGDTPVDVASLAAALDARTGALREALIFLRADQSLDYGALMGVLDALRAGGYLKVALVGLEATP
ncbi:TonB system transport protein ExbD [Paracoccaceae bacterium Fryx2]|nr:TonB system transport protein ExbD [Paracoccaceae bacterium Fryx2]